MPFDSIKNPFDMDNKVELPNNKTFGEQNFPHRSFLINKESI